jgi:hypothetical protein
MYCIMRIVTFMYRTKFLPQVSYHGIPNFTGPGDVIALAVLHLLCHPHLHSPEHFENMVQRKFLTLQAVVVGCFE